MNFTQNHENIFNKIEDIAIKRENAVNEHAFVRSAAGYQHFLFPQCLKKNIYFF